MRGNYNSFFCKEFVFKDLFSEFASQRSLLTSFVSQTKLVSFSDNNNNSNNNVKIMSPVLTVVLVLTVKTGQTSFVHIFY